MSCSPRAWHQSKAAEMILQSRSRTLAWGVGIVLAFGACSRTSPDGSRSPQSPSAATDRPLVGSSEGNTASIPAATTSKENPSTDRSGSPWFVNIAPEAGITQTLFCGGPNKNHILES